MKKADFKKLNAGDRVVVTGIQDETKFAGEAGLIISKEHDTNIVHVLFDKWNAGHGINDRQWNFEEQQARNFTIKVQHAAPVKPTVVKKWPHGAQEYKGNGKHKWEPVERDGIADTTTVRLRVPGGWLYRVTCGTYTKAMTFVPVPQAVGYAV